MIRKQVICSFFALVGLAMAILLLGCMMDDPEPSTEEISTSSFNDILWNERTIDVLVIGLILVFLGVLGVMSHASENGGMHGERRSR